MSSNFLPKYSKDRPHHYFIGVAVKPANSSAPGEFYLKYGPVYVDNETIDRICDSLMRMNDEVYKQTPEEAMKIEGCFDLGVELSMMKVSCEVNQCTIHHISTAEKWDDEMLVEFVKMANNSKELRKKLEESRIR